MWRTARNGCPTLAAAPCGCAGAADAVAVAAGPIITPAAGVSFRDIVVGPAAGVVGADLDAFAVVARPHVGGRHGEPPKKPKTPRTHREKVPAQTIFIAGKSFVR